MAGTCVFLGSCHQDFNRMINQLPPKLSRCLSMMIVDRKLIVITGVIKGAHYHFMTYVMQCNYAN